MESRKPSREELLQSARNVAANITAFAETVEFHPDQALAHLDIIDFQLDCSYDEFISLLSRAGLATPEAAGRTPDDDLRTRINPILSEVELDLDRVYSDSRKGRTFIAHSAWSAMKAAPEFPRDAGADYEALHYSLEFLGLAPLSPEMCEFLGTTPEDFKRVDQKFAKAAAYENLTFHQAMMNFAATRIMSNDRQQYKDLAHLFQSAREYDRVYDRSFESFEEDTQRIIKQSNLTEQELAFYILTRLEAEGRIPGGPDPHAAMN